MGEFEYLFIQFITSVRVMQFIRVAFLAFVGFALAAPVPGKSYSYTS